MKVEKRESQRRLMGNGNCGAGGAGKRKVWRRGPRMMAVLLVMLLAGVLAGCGASSSSDNSNMATSSSGSMATANQVAFDAVDQYGDDIAPRTVATSANSAKAETAESPRDAEPTSVAGSSSSSNVIGAMDRKLIYNANVTMEVTHYGDAQTELFNIISLSGGYLTSFSDNQSTYELGGTFIVKIPSNGFQSFLSQVEELKKGDKFNRNVRAQDVTEEYVDLESRLKAKQVVEARLLGFMDRATDSKDLLSYSNELASVQEQIEQMKGRMRYIDQNVAYSTVELRMYQKLEGGKDVDNEERNAFERAASAMKGSSKAILSFLEGLVIVLAGAIPILILLAVVLVPLIILYRKSSIRRARMEKPEQKAPYTGYGMKVDDRQGGPEAKPEEKADENPENK